MKKLKLNVNRVIRGGGWGSPASYLRAANRNNDSPSYQINLIGDRLTPRFVRSKR